MISIVNNKYIIHSVVTPFLLLYLCLHGWPILTSKKLKNIINTHFKARLAEHLPQIPPLLSR